MQKSILEVCETGWRGRRKGGIVLCIVKHREGSSSLSNDYVWGLLRDRGHGWMIVGGIQETRVDPLPNTWRHGKESHDTTLSLVGLLIEYVKRTFVPSFCGKDPIKSGMRCSVWSHKPNVGFSIHKNIIMSLSTTKCWNRVEKGAKLLINLMGWDLEETCKFCFLRVTSSHM